MDVSQRSPAAKVRAPIFREINCDICDYPRTGLPPEALCPECGAAPKQVLKPAIQSTLVARSRSEQAWLGMIAVGLILLIFSSIAAIRVVLIMPLGGLTLVALNAPAPKFVAAALLQRSIGDPGEWGVFGTVAVLVNLVAVWLVTEPHSMMGDEHFGLSSRRLARWLSVILGGALFGTLLGGYSLSPYNGWLSMHIIIATVGMVEMPANAFLYLHFRHLALRLHAADPARSRELPLLRAIPSLLVALCIAGIAITLLRGEMEDEPVVAWRIVQSIYGMAALTCGVMMIISVLHLLRCTLAGTMDESMRIFIVRIVRLPRTLRRILLAARAKPQHWLAICGLMLWLSNNTSLNAVNFGIGHRLGLGGDIPSINFVGPKIFAVPLIQTESDHYWYVPESRESMLWIVVGIWLITSFRPRGISDRSATVVRWTPTCLIGLAMGLGMAIDRASGELKQSLWISILVVAIEVPCTLLAYLYLASIARSIGRTDLSKMLRYSAITISALIAMPVSFIVLARPLRQHLYEPAIVLINGVYGSIGIVMSLIGIFLIIRLLGALISDSMTAEDNSPIIATR